MIPALTTPARTETLEQARELWRTADAAEFKRKHAFKRGQALGMYRLFQRWTLETGLLSRREFMQWLSGEAKPATRLYDSLNAGYALERGLDFDYGVSDLAYLGRALDKMTPAEIHALPDLERVERCKALVVNSRTEGQVAVPVTNAPAIRDAINKVSESEKLPAPEALALIVQGHEAMSPEMQASVLEAGRTGRTISDAAQHVVRQMLDSRGWLSRQKCFVPGCGLPSQELHHLKLPGTRFRSQEILTPLCIRHHAAHTGEQSAHANHQAEWIAKHWQDEAAFWRDLSTMYAHRLFGPSGGLNSIQDGENATME